MKRSVRGEATRRMAQALVDNGNTISDIARLAGVSRPTVYAWLRGVPSTRNFDKLVELADLYSAAERL